MVSRQTLIVFGAVLVVIIAATIFTVITTPNEKEEVEKKNITIGDNTIIIFEEPEYTFAKIDSGFGDVKIYDWTELSYEKTLYKEVNWLLRRSGDGIPVLYIWEAD